MQKIGQRFSRYSLLARKTIWRARNDYSPLATPCYVLGVQRSGTTMILDCLDQSMAVEILAEESKAMNGFYLKPNDELEDVIRTTRHRLVVFKPLLDAHRSPELLALTPKSKALWVFRLVEDRANSAVAKFGSNNLDLLTAFSNGRQLDTWQAQGLTGEDVELIESFDYTDMSPHVAAAIFWYVRNSIFFSTGLDEMDNVLPIAYEDLVSKPAEVMPGICRFLGCDYNESMIKDIHSRSVGRSPSNLSERVEALCSPLYDRLHAIQKTRWPD